MTHSQVQERIAAHEDGWTELKTSGARLSEIGDTICAFANTLNPSGGAGVVLIGVTDKGDIVGVDGADSLQGKILRHCKDRIHPAIVPECSTVVIDGKVVLVVEVPYTRNGPHFTGPAYVRHGSGNVNATSEQLDLLVASRSDKAYHLRRMEGTHVWVKFLGRRTGEGKEFQARVMEADVHGVHLLDIGSSQRLHCEYRYTHIGYDHRKHSQKLTVDPYGIQAS